MSERNEKRIINAIFAVIAIVIIVFAVDIEIKLSRLMNSEPMVVNTNGETTQATTVDVYSFHNELTADKATETNISAEANYTQVNTTEPSTEIVNDTTVLYTQPTTVESTTQFVTSAISEVYPSTEPSATEVPSTIWSVDADQNLYRSKTGNKYHKADCSYLKNSRILVTVDEIINEGYEPCSKCMKGE